MHRSVPICRQSHVSILFISHEPLMKYPRLSLCLVKWTRNLMKSTDILLFTSQISHEIQKQTHDLPIKSSNSKYPHTKTQPFFPYLQGKYPQRADSFDPLWPSHLWDALARLCGARHLEVASVFFVPLFTKTIWKWSQLLFKTCGTCLQIGLKMIFEKDGGISKLWAVVGP